MSEEDRFILLPINKAYTKQLGNNNGSLLHEQRLFTKKYELDTNLSNIKGLKVGRVWEL